MYPSLMYLFIIRSYIFNNLLPLNEAQKHITVYTRPMQHFLVLQIASCLKIFIMSRLNLDIISRNKIFEIAFFNNISHPSFTSHAPTTKQ